MYALEDTIAAIATPLGQGGVGIVRLSGPSALEVARGLFRTRRGALGRQPISHHLYHGYIIDLAAERIVDEALLSYMRAPHSYTGEDVVELNVHGGGMPVR